jgi:hypothetical protein
MGIWLFIETKWGFGYSKAKTVDLAIQRPKMEMWLFIDQK